MDDIERGMNQRNEELISPLKNGKNQLMRRPTSYGEKLFQISKQRLDQNLTNKKKPVTPKKTLKGPKVTDSMKD